MPDRKPRGQKPYTVGYGRPPEASQFKPGRSGNPKGRPKDVKSVGTILDGISRQRVTVTEGQRTRRLSPLEVMLRRLANDAMRGDLKALRLILSLIERNAASPGTNLKLDELLAEDNAILARYLKSAGEAEAEPTPASGKPEDKDDV